MNIKNGLFLLLSTAMLLGNSIMSAETQANKDNRQSEETMSLRSSATLITGALICAKAGAAIGSTLGILCVKFMVQDPNIIDVQDFLWLTEAGEVVGACAGLVGGVVLHQQMEHMFESDPLKETTV